MHTLRNKLKNGYVFLQETHSVQNIEKEWKSQWGRDIFFSHGKSNSTGCSIAFSKNCAAKIISQAKDENGRLLILEASIQDKKYLLINFTILIQS